MNKITKWTEKRINTLKGLVNQEFNTIEIAEKMEISQLSIISKLSRLKIKAVRKNDWKPSEIIKLKELVQNGKTPEEISKILNKTTKAVYNKKCKLRITIDNKWTQSELSLYFKCRQEGKTCEEISKILNKSISAVQNINSRKKFKFLSYRKWSKEDKDQLINLFHSGKTPEEIQLIINRSVGSIIGKLIKLGIYRRIKKNKKSTVFLENFEEIIEYPRIFRTRLKSVEKRAKKRKLNFGLEYQDLIDIWKRQDGLCFYTGLKMGISGKVYGFSVERKDSDGPYYKSNIVLCCNIVNRMKSNLPMSEFFNICKLIVDKSISINYELNQNSTPP